MTPKNTWKRPKATPKPRSERLALYEANKMLVYAVYRGLPKTQQNEDVEGVLMAGLWKALNKYDPANGAMFSTYATVTIRNAWRNHCRDSSQFTGWGYECVGKLMKASREGLLDLDADSPEDIAAVVGITVGQVRSVLVYAAQGGVGMDAGIGETGPGFDGMRSKDRRRMVEASEESCREWTPGSVLDRLDAENAMSCLNPRQREVVEGIYFNEETASEVSRRIGLSRERVRQIHEEAMARMRTAMEVA